MDLLLGPVGPVFREKESKLHSLPSNKVRDSFKWSRDVNPLLAHREDSSYFYKRTKGKSVTRNITNHSSTFGDRKLTPIQSDRLNVYSVSDRNLLKCVSS